jgi:trans-2,3-dihydro-3-hydroxyanthranilate isomerase
MIELPYVVVDVFTDTPLTGNQLAVFTDATALSAERMQALAREVNFAESTFFVGDGERGPRVRIFTPEVELPFAGHPTLGTAVTLLSDARFGGKRDGAITLELGVGAVPVDVAATDYGARAQLLAPIAKRLPCAIAPPDLAAAVGLSVVALDTTLPPAIWSCGNAFAFVAVRDSAAVARARLTLAATPAGWPLGIVVFALEDLQAHARVFIPGSAVPEDPATGSANAPLIAYLHSLGRVREGELLVTRQGIEMKRPSRLEARLVRDGENELRPSVGGGVVTVARGTFMLPS